MFKKATTSLNKTLLTGLITLFSSKTFAAWGDLNMTEGVTAISKEVFDLHMLIFCALFTWHYKPPTSWMTLMVGCHVSSFRMQY